MERKMRVSFCGNIYLRANTYSIENQNGMKSSSENSADMEINTDRVSYITHQPGSEETALHMQNGDVITPCLPFNASMYDIAQQLSASQGLKYDDNGQITIYDNSIDKLREAIKAKGMTNENSAPIADTPQVSETSAEKTENKPTETKPTGLTNTYNFQGIDYAVVGINGFDSLDGLLAYIADKGMTNRGKGGNDWPGKCHNFSCEYGDIILGTSKIDINSDSAAAQAAKGNDRQFQNASCGTPATALELMKDELEAGRPCVVKITKKGENHFGLVCGIRKDADMNNLKNTDFLYIDSYDGKLGQLNGDGFRRLDNWKNGVHIWKGKDYNFSYAVKNQCAKKFRSPEEVKASYGIA